MSNILTQALEYFDKNNEKFSKLRNKIKYVSVYTTKEGIKKRKLIFFDENKNKLFTSRFEIISKFYKKPKIWVWGWGVPNISNYLTNIIRKLWNYGVSLEYNDTKIQQLVLKNDLITSRFVINDDTQLDIHLSLASYLTKIPYTYFISDEFINENIEMIQIDDESYENSETIYFIYLLDNPIDSE
jgi:hypothetical protein